MIIVCISETHAIAQDTTYFDVSWKATTVGNAAYFRKKLKTDSGWRVSDYFMSGKTQMTGCYTDDSCKIEQGEFVWYDNKGNLYHRCNYNQGKSEGSDILYYHEGGKRMEGTNKAGKKVGEWLGYYPSGKLSAKAQFEDGNQVSASFYNEDGTKNELVTVFYREDAYPGGANAWLEFLNKHLKYPSKALKRNVQGMVIIGFNITKTGKISDITVVRSVDKELDDEAVRIIKRTENWDPLIIGGIACDAYHKQPIIFRFDD